MAKHWRKQSIIRKQKKWSDEDLDPLQSIMNAVKYWEDPPIPELDENGLTSEEAWLDYLLEHRHQKLGLEYKVKRGTRWCKEGLPLVPFPLVKNDEKKI